MKERIIELWDELRMHVKAFVILSIEAFKLKMAMLLADIKQAARNKRYHVLFIVTGINKQGLPIEKLRSINEEEFNYCKRMKWLPKRMTFLELERKAFYSTPLRRNNSQSREQRRRAMKKYMRYQKVINQLKH
jgi:hypothetical protein